MFLLLLENKLFLSPVGPNPQKVLDVGTGTGIWAIDFADQFPNATVIGTDLSPTQPSWVPPNCKFEIDDASIEWMYPKESFDFIHVRSLLGSIRDWPAFYQEAYKRHLKPGGWFEQLEMSVTIQSDDDTISEDHVFSRWGRIFVAIGEKLGKTFRILDLSRGYVTNAGFVDVVEERFKMPIGPWSSDPKYREIGRWNQLHCEEGIEGWAMALLTRVEGWSYLEVQVLLAEMRTALRDRKMHSYITVSVVYGKKPL
ncbi:hypothetical protein FGG08_004834 [Glutinoglossum americanum]|uniref:S-adenosyl-L-methionine-dependent methyltransferase n=1 Tax=Glutinoglossum americanum TaxID=1670608 RepID=A0A9P8I8F2_9PEZI|nr:hypothetical protein FGG08_004834 [Glutinoglossum americanum]